MNKKKKSQQEIVPDTVENSPAKLTTEAELVAALNRFLKDRSDRYRAFLPERGRADFSSFADFLYAVALGIDGVNWSYTYPKKEKDSRVSTAVRNKIDKAKKPLGLPRREKKAAKKGQDKGNRNFVNFILMGFVSATIRKKYPNVRLSDYDMRHFNTAGCWDTALHDARQIFLTLTQARDCILGMNPSDLLAEAKPLHAGLLAHVQDKIAPGGVELPEGVATIEDTLRGIFIAEAPAIALRSMGAEFKKNTERFSEFFPGEIGKMIRTTGITFDSVMQQEDGSQVLSVEAFVDKLQEQQKAISKAEAIADTAGKPEPPRKTGRDRTPPVDISPPKPPTVDGYITQFGDGRPKPESPTSESATKAAAPERSPRPSPGVLAPPTTVGEADVAATANRAPDSPSAQTRFASLLEDAIAPTVTAVLEYTLLCAVLLFGGLAVAAATGFLAALTTSIYYPLGVIGSAALMKWGVRLIQKQ